MRESVPLQPNSWTRGDSPTRDPGGEYVPVAFLTDGGLAVVTPIQDERGYRWGFSWWRIDVEVASARAFCRAPWMKLKDHDGAG